MSTVLFTTVPVNSEIGKANTLWFKPKNDKCATSLASCQEVINLTGEPITARRLDRIMTDSFDALMELCMKSGKSYRLGPIVCKLSISGTTTDPLCATLPDDCTAKIIVSAASGFEREVDSSCVTFINAQTGTKATIVRFRTLGSLERNMWQKGSTGVLGGANLIMLEGDTLTASYLNGSETVTLNLTVIESDASYIKIEWPSELDAVAVETELTFTLTSRGGIEDATPQTTTFKATLTNAAE